MTGSVPELLQTNTATHVCLDMLLGLLNILITASRLGTGFGSSADDRLSSCILTVLQSLSLLKAVV